VRDVSARTITPATPTGSTRSVASVTDRDRTATERSSATLDFHGAASQRRTSRTGSATEADTRTESRTAAAVRPQTRPSRNEVEQKRSVRIQSDSRTASLSRSAVASTDLRQTAAVSSRSGSGRYRTHQRVEPASKIIINNDNRVIIQGSPTRYSPRPHISRRLFHDVSYIRRDPHWFHYGSGFYFRWSSSSLGVVVSLPYYHHTTVHYGTPYYGLSYYYPNYHRKYVFVSVGGYWPYTYRYRRYYWYGTHPYYWYGSHVVYEPAPVVNYNTYNYYTTNTTNTDSAGYGFSSSAQPYYTLGSPKEEDVIDAPQFETAADLSFDHAVTLFEAGNYDAAVDQFREAVNLSPDDIILPFTYSQALFARGDYAHAASVLRTAMLNIPDDELTIYYPRGLYEDEAILTGQVEQLRIAAEREPFASDYQLLLGYHYLGLGDLEKAAMPLVKASADPANQVAAGKLLELAARLESEMQADSGS
jgi:tetratricopeptide (TPR) repeat protein